MDNNKIKIENNEGGIKLNNQNSQSGNNIRAPGEDDKYVYQ